MSPPLFKLIMHQFGIELSISSSYISLFIMSQNNFNIFNYASVGSSKYLNHSTFPSIFSLVAHIAHIVKAYPACHYVGSKWPFPAKLNFLISVTICPQPMEKVKKRRYKKEGSLLDWAVRISSACGFSQWIFSSKVWTHFLAGWKQHKKSFLVFFVNFSFFLSKPAAAKAQFTVFLQAWICKGSIEKLPT